MEDLLDKLSELRKEIIEEIRGLRSDLNEKKIGELDYSLRTYGLISQMVAINRYSVKMGLVEADVISQMDQYEAEVDSLREEVLERFLINPPKNH